jgi:hypothetical protein
LSSELRVASECFGDIAIAEDEAAKLGIRKPEPK